MQTLATIFHDRLVTTFVSSQEHSFSTLGGPIELELSGLAPGARLHQLLHLNHNDLSALAPPRFVWDLPLLFGITHSGCELTYTFEHGKASIEAISPPEATEGWPYRHFPNILPYYPIKPGSQCHESWEQFIQRGPNLPKEQPAELVVLMPPPVGMGFTLWGRGGDAEGVVVVFEVDLSGRRVRASTRCG